MADRRRLLRWVRRSRRVSLQVGSALRGAVDGFWLGVLDDDALAMLDGAYYAEQSQYSDPAYNTSGFHPWERAAIERWFPPDRGIALTSAGGGREVLALTEAGRKVWPFEPNADLVQAGNDLLIERDVAARIRLSSRSRFPALETPAGALVVGWGGYMLMRGRGVRIAFLQDAVTQLLPDSPVLLSFFVTKQAGGAYARTAAAVGTAIGRISGRPVELGDALVPNYVHVFTRDELESELTTAGLEIVAFGDEGYGWAVARTAVATGTSRT